jgi:hypothetical protein
MEMVYHTIKHGDIVFLRSSLSQVQGFLSLNRVSKNVSQGFSSLSGFQSLDFKVLR